jgi:hypothetical protein
MNSTSQMSERVTKRAGRAMYSGVTEKKRLGAQDLARFRRERRAYLRWSSRKRSSKEKESCTVAWIRAMRTLPPGRREEAREIARWHREHAWRDRSEEQKVKLELVLAVSQLAAFEQGLPVLRGLGQTSEPPALVPADVILDALGDSDPSDGGVSGGGGGGDEELTALGFDMESDAHFDSLACAVESAPPPESRCPSDVDPFDPYDKMLAIALASAPFSNSAALESPIATPSTATSLFVPSPRPPPPLRGLLHAGSIDAYLAVVNQGVQ